MLPGANGNRRRGYKHVLAELQQQYDQLQSQVSALEHHHKTLEQTDAVMTALCESMMYMHVSSSSSSSSYDQEHKQQHPRQHQEHEPGQEMSVAVLQRLGDLLTAEEQLLQQLESLPAPPTGRHLELLHAASVDGQGYPSIAPANDPTAPMREVGLSVAEHAHSVSSMELTLLYRATVPQLALHLQLLDAGIESRETSLENIKTTLQKLLHYVVSCNRLGRVAVVREYEGRNADTLGEPDFEALVRHNSRVGEAVGKVLLTPAQEEVIAKQWQVWTRLCAPLNEELATLQQQLDSDDSTCSSNMSSGGSTTAQDAAAAAAAATAAVLSTRSAGLSAADALPSRAAALEAHMQRLERMQVVLEKKHALNLVGYCHMVGRFSWPQLARLVVLTWPYPVSIVLVWSIVQQNWEKRQQQQRQQQQQQRRQRQQ